jgi:hypothetical protein
MRQLGSALSDRQITLNAFRSEVCRSLSEKFCGTRASLWYLVEAPDGRRLRCVGLHAPGLGFGGSGAELLEKDYGGYFAALLERGAYLSDDVWVDDNLQGLRAYFEETGVRALMDTVFQINGEAVGVICIEETRCSRHWTPAELASLRRGAAGISLAMARLGPRYHFGMDDGEADGPPPELDG